jgi:hypothetical protein
VARNWTEQADPSRRLEFLIDGWGVVAELLIPPLQKGESRELPPPAVRFDENSLEDLTNNLNRVVRLRIDGHLLEGDALECRLLAHNEWSLHDENRLSLAALVLPNHPLICRIAHEACGNLSSMSSPESVLHALASYLRDEWRIAYRREPPGVEVGVQKIRFPHQVLLNVEQRSGQGTCIDIALLIAGCLEQRGLHAVIAILSQAGGRHALVGCWKRRRPSLEPIISDRERLVGGISWIDPNGLTEDSDQRIEITACTDLALKELAAAPAFWAVDITAARSEGIEPLPFAGSPDWSEPVLLAIRAANDLATAVQTELGTIALFLGLATLQNGVTRAALLSRFEDVETVLNRLAQAARKEVAPGASSKNYQLAWIWRGPLPSTMALRWYQNINWFRCY